MLALALIIGGWFLQRGIAQEESVYGEAQLFDQIVDHVAGQYVDEIDRDLLYEYAIEGVLERLGDPNTSLLSSEAYEDFRIQTQGDYGGVGLQIVDRDDAITVVSPVPGTPGERAGIRAGDRIIEVAGQPIRGWSSEQAVQILRGEPGSPVDVRIERPGMSRPLDFTLIREQIQIRSVPFSAMLDDGVGYIPLSVFSETSTNEVQAAADSLRDAGATAFILDLRGNPGGVLDEGVGVTDLFLERGQGIVETRGNASGPNGAFRASSGDRYEGMPVVVLVDRGSASASEIVAGALQDHDRALLIGSSTFGKGSVQSLFFGLSGGHTLKLTTARWYTPLGRTIDRTGVGTEREEIEVSTMGPVDLMGQYSAIPDTAGRPVVVSESGRALYGGGGIVPDMLIGVDTLSTQEQEAVMTVLEQAGEYGVRRFNFGVEYIRDHPDLDLAAFEITDADMEAFLSELAEGEELEADRETLEAASRFLRLELEREIAFQAAGAQGAFERRLPYDRPVQTALELLGMAASPAELFDVSATSTGALEIARSEPPGSADL